ncbi:MAG: peptidoglycan-binding protein [Cellulosilyticaceae bacterium]
MSTNTVGQTPIIELNAPPEELTQTPEYTIQPYSNYIIEVNSEEYIPVIVQGSQIFSTITSIQPIQLIPSSRKSFLSTRQTDETIEIGASTLYGNYPPKIPEAEVKDVKAKGFITLDEVIVPEFVIVHDGSPNNNNASNYTVAFKDYIKNVASSEIYPTWPDETILANILAIISFTLNRIFTEWYRNQGKNFTITNSTAFDHAFFYGRNIFDTISKVVDQNFDTYIKRPGVVQPLFTQYCDGAKSQCPNWMTQWGSKKLGDDGLSHQEILRFYYGSDIIFPEAQTVQGVPESYPGSPLKLGSSGKDVRKIQEQLNRIAQNYPLIPKVKSNGNFDEATKEAVKTFQKIFHLTQDGVVGKDTWYKISQIFTAVTKMAELI